MTNLNDTTFSFIQEPSQKKKTNYRTKRLIGVMVGNALTKLILWGTFAMTLLVLAPQSIMSYYTLNMGLPISTQWIIAFGYFAYNHWHFSVPIILAIYASDMLVTFRLNSRRSSSTQQLYWKIGAFILPSIILVSIVFAIIILPFLKALSDASLL